MSKKDSGANYFASMTDMMVGILFIFIIMIAYFAFQVVSSNKENPLLVYIDRGEELRQGLAEKVADDLRKHNIDATVNPKNPGVVTLRGRGIFANGASSVDSIPGSKEKIEYLSDVLFKKMDCYVYGSQSNPLSKECNNKSLIYLESVFIEGHTDNQAVPPGGLPDGSKNNLELSARRATNTYKTLVEKNPNFTKYKNPVNEEVLSVAAYGEQRPMESNTTVSGQDANRRIDIRFVMWVPKNGKALVDFKEEQLKLYQQK